jgi:hypothetical protein
MAGATPIDVQSHLKGVNYPATKAELIQTAEENGAPADVIQVLEDLPDQDFGGPEEVSEAFSRTP